MKKCKTEQWPTTKEGKKAGGLLLWSQLENGDDQKSRKTRKINSPSLPIKSLNYRKKTNEVLLQSNGGDALF